MSLAQTQLSSCPTPLPHLTGRWAFLSLPFHKQRGHGAGNNRLTPERGGCATLSVPGAHCGAAPTFTPARDLDLALSLVSFSFRGGGLLPGQSPNTFCSQPHQKRGLWDSGTPNPTRPGLSRKKHENVLSRVGVDFYNSTTCLIVGTSPTTSMCQLQRDREHFRIPCAPAWVGDKESHGPLPPRRREPNTMRG